jgi:hypothetical protein
MIPETSNPTHAGGVVGLGIVKAVAADDFLRNTASSKNFQALWLEQRFRLSPLMARYVAELAFTATERRA